MKYSFLTVLILNHLSAQDFLKDDSQNFSPHENLCPVENRTDFKLISLEELKENIRKKREARQADKDAYSSPFDK